MIRLCIALLSGLLLAAQTPAPPKITRAYYKEIRETDPSFGTIGIKMHARMLVLFQTDAPLPVGTDISVRVSYSEDNSSDGCSFSWASSTQDPNAAPESVDGWYTVECTRLSRTKTVGTVWVLPTFGRAQAQKLQ